MGLVKVKGRHDKLIEENAILAWEEEM